MVINGVVLDNLQSMNNENRQMPTEFSTILHCNYFPLCSGCSIQGQVSPPPIWKDITEFFHLAAPNVPLSLKTGSVTGWRTRSKLAVRGNSQVPEIGLFKQGSHAVVSIPDCPLHHPAINRLYESVRKKIVECKIEPYDEELGRGILRYVQFVVERKTNRVQLTLVVNRQSLDPSLEKFARSLYHAGSLHSLYFNFQPAQSNTIFGREWHFFDGETYLWERIGSADCAFHPACFGQAHLELFEQTLATVRAWVPSDASVLELYAGVGVIGFNLVSQSRDVLCVEINPYAAECFHLSRLKLPLEDQKKITMQISSSEAALSSIPGRDVIVVDPPRKGLDAVILAALCEAPENTQLIYLSCGPLSFQRDVKKLLARGWVIEKAESYLFFPGSDHVEILCSLRRKVSG